MCRELSLENADKCTVRPFVPVLLLLEMFCEYYPTRVIEYKYTGLVAPITDRVTGRSFFFFFAYSVACGTCFSCPLSLLPLLCAGRSKHSSSSVLARGGVDILPQTRIIQIRGRRCLHYRIVAHCRYIVYETFFWGAPTCIC